MTKYRARLSASRRAAVLVLLVVAVAALAAGVYLLVAPDGGCLRALPPARRS